MGLRTLAYYFDRAEAVVVQSVLLDAGILAILGNEDLLRMRPNFTMALGGHRLLVSEFDLEEAIAVIHEALNHPITDGGVLIVRSNFLDRIACVLLGYFAGGAPSPLRSYEWRE